MENIDFYKLVNPEKTNIITLSDKHANHIIIDESPKSSSMIREFKLTNNDVKVVEILHIFVHPEYRKNHIGTKLLQAIAKLYEDRVILTLVGASEKEYPNLDEKDIPEILSNLKPFYEKNNFVNVNNMFGSYSMYIPMLYVGNSIGKTIKNKLYIQNVEDTSMLSDKDKLLKSIELIDGTFENIIIGHLNRYSSDFTASRLNNLISTISSIINEKIKTSECAVANASEYATYVKMYLEGKLYTSKEAAEANIDIQIKNIDAAIKYCEDAMNS